MKGKDEFQPSGGREPVFSSGVLHHIAVNERAKWMSVLAGAQDVVLSRSAGC